MTAAEYAFCESAWALSVSKWHIRKLTKNGKRLGGGADTKALCGREVAWDLTVPLLADLYAKSICPKCLDEYRRLHDGQ
jgi:hypothetical protein